MNRRALLKSLGLMPLAKTLPAVAKPAIETVAIAPSSMRHAMTATVTVSTGGTTHVSTYEIDGADWHQVVMKSKYLNMSPDEFLHLPPYWIALTPTSTR